MKSILLSIFLLLNVFAADTITIKSWNLLHLSAKNLHTKKDKAFIQKYLSKNDYDVFAIEEVLDKKTLSELTNLRVLYSKKSGRKSYKEFIAFIVADKYRDSQLKVYNYYDSHDTFERDPAMLAMDHKFGVVGVHLVYGRKKAYGNGLTKKEIQGLTNLTKYFSKKSGISEDNIVIAGDFNLCASKIKEVIPSNQRVLIKKATTVSTSKKRIAANNYDHFIVHKNVKVEEAFVDYTVLNGDKSIKHRKWFRKHVSDHYPIIEKLTFN